MALQHTRGHSFREEQRKLANDYLKLQYERVNDEGIRHMLRRRGMSVTPASVQAVRKDLDDLKSGELFVRPQDAALVGQAVRAADYIGEYLLYRDWAVYRTPPILVTCDEPLILLGGPGWPRTKRAGIANSGVIVFPLAPDALLAMPHPDLAGVRGGELDHGETAEINREICIQAARWAFERPSRKITTKVSTPPPPEPTVLEREVAITKRGEVVRSYRPTRWINVEDPPPWPVSRWWRGARYQH